MLPISRKLGRCLACFAAFVAAACLLPAAPGQTTAKLGAPEIQGEAGKVESLPQPVYVRPSEESRLQPIDLVTALRLAGTNNLDIAQAQQFVAQASAVLQRANAQLLPNINVGSTYVDHDGQIQKTEGNIIKAN